MASSSSAASHGSSVMKIEPLSNATYQASSRSISRATASNEMTLARTRGLAWAARSSAMTAQTARSILRGLVLASFWRWPPWVVRRITALPMWRARSG